jgi:hypothetical protein
MSKRRSESPTMSRSVLYDTQFIELTREEFGIFDAELERRLEGYELNDPEAVQWAMYYALTKAGQELDEPQPSKPVLSSKRSHTLAHVMHGLKEAESVESWQLLSERATRRALAEAKRLEFVVEEVEPRGRTLSRSRARVSEKRLWAFPQVMAALVVACMLAITILLIICKKRGLL